VAFNALTCSFNVQRSAVYLPHLCFLFTILMLLTSIM